MSARRRRQRRRCRCWRGRRHWCVRGTGTGVGKSGRRCCWRAVRSLRNYSLNRFGRCRIEQPAGADADCYHRQYQDCQDSKDGRSLATGRPARSWRWIQLRDRGVRSWNLLRSQRRDPFLRAGAVGSLAIRGKCPDKKFLMIVRQLIPRLLVRIRHPNIVGTAGWKEAVYDELLRPA